MIFVSTPDPQLLRGGSCISAQTTLKGCLRAGSMHSDDGGHGRPHRDKIPGKREESIAVRRETDSAADPPKKKAKNRSPGEDDGDVEGPGVSAGPSGNGIYRIGTERPQTVERAASCISHCCISHPRGTQRVRTGCSIGSRRILSPV